MTTQDIDRGEPTTGVPAIRHRRSLVVLLALLGTAAFAGCAAPGTPVVAGSSSASSLPSPASPAPADQPRLLGPDEFAAAIGDNGRVVVNVHTPYEGEIEGTDLAIPFDRVIERRSELPADLATPIALYCKTGRMSADASRTLAGLGYRNVIDLQGGMVAWSASGRTLLP